MGFRSGEYGGKNSSVAPVWWMRYAVSGDLRKAALSMMTRCSRVRRGQSLVLSQELNTSVSDVPSNRVLQNPVRYGRRSVRCAAFDAPMSGHTRAVPWAHTHSGESRKAGSRTHRYRRAADRAGRTAPDGAGTVFVASGCALCSLSFFFRVHPILCSAFQMQWRETPKCWAASACVMSACVSTRRRNAAQSSLWDV